MFALALATALQQQPKIPAETQQFAFWVGEWRCEGTLYGPTATKTRGTNRVTMDLGGHVVHEHFATPGSAGESWSVYVPKAKKWRQTWVDDAGGYIALEGGWADGKMILSTLPNPANPNASSRMVFSNIAKDSFDWVWEGTTDGGKTWKPSWQMHYTRTKLRG